MKGTKKIAEYGKNTRFGNGDLARKAQKKSTETKRRRKKLRLLLEDLDFIDGKISPTDFKNKIKLYKLRGLIQSDLNTCNLNIGINYLYFISGDHGIKIGYSNNPENRLKDIRRAMDSNAKLIKSIAGADSYEAKLHSKFRKYNIKGNSTLGTEWFRYNEELEALIDSVNTLEDLNNYFSGKKYKTTKATQNTQKRIINTPQSYTLFNQLSNSI